jgi:hypothetical protein
VRLLDRFEENIKARFVVDSKPYISWFLQARIRQDKDKNIKLDQTRYALSIIERYLPHASTPTPGDMKKYQSPLQYDFKWTKDDNSDHETCKAGLEHEYGIKLLEVAGSLNYLANTDTQFLFGQHGHSIPICHPQALPLHSNARTQAFPSCHSHAESPTLLSTAGYLFLSRCYEITNCRSATQSWTSRHSIG